MDKLLAEGFKLSINAKMVQYRTKNRNIRDTLHGFCEKLQEWLDKFAEEYMATFTAFGIVAFEFNEEYKGGFGGMVVVGDNAVSKLQSDIRRFLQYVPIYEKVFTNTQAGKTLISELEQIVNKVLYLSQMK